MLKSTCLRIALTAAIALCATPEFTQLAAQRRGGGGGSRPTPPQNVFPLGGGRSAPGAGDSKDGGGQFGGSLPPLIYPRANNRTPGAGPSPLDSPQAPGPTTEAGRTVPLTELPELDDLKLEYFAIADYDHNGWISFRESVASMSTDRGEFRSFDSDRDGRIQPEEFGERLVEIVGLVGSFRPPRLQPSNTPSTSAEDSATDALVASADIDRDGKLTAFELTTIFQAFGVEDLDAALVLTSYDRDLSGNLDSGELGDIANALREGNLAIAPAPLVAPESIDQLFGVPVPRKKLPSGAASTLPSRLVGPVTHFYRLDADRDGRVTPEDLISIQTPLHLDVRARAILAFLDSDGDGMLAPDELRSAFE